MEYRRLGETELDVSVMGLGTGGPSMFGQKTGADQRRRDRLVRRALELGINFFDSSPAYGDSEEMLGHALNGVPRDQYVLATKLVPVPPPSDQVLSPQEAIASVEASLTRLRVDSVDILQLHGVAPEHYRWVVDTLLPCVQRLREQGKY